MNLACPACGDKKKLNLGKLGRLQWWRCKGCSLTYNHTQGVKEK